MRSEPVEKECVEHRYLVGKELIAGKTMVVVTCASCPYHWVAGKARSNKPLARWFRKYFTPKE